MPPLSIAYMKKYGRHCKYFLETGTYAGETVDNALKCHFEKIISIELDEKIYKQATIKYKGRARVILYQGDSADMMETMLSDHIDAPALIFLDAHFCGVDSHTGLGHVWIPVEQELDRIAEHKIHNHVIIIDDMSTMENTHFDQATKTWAGAPGWMKLLQKFKSINPLYRIVLQNQTDKIIAYPDDNPDIDTNIQDIIDQLQDRFVKQKMSVIHHLIEQLAALNVTPDFQIDFESRDWNELESWNIQLSNLLSEKSSSIE